jgi:pyruvate-formate lyase-activating enzyme
MNTIDELGTIKASLAALKTDETRLKDRVVAMATRGTAGTETWSREGDLFRASVSWSDKVTTDWKAVAEDLAQRFDIPQADLARILKKHTSTLPDVVTVRVSARKVTA